MLFYLLVASLASIFYYIGNSEYYQKGWLLAILSIVMSLGVTMVLPLALLSALRQVCGADSALSSASPEELA